MNITVLGAGNIGGTIGKKWAAAGHRGAFGVRNPSDADTQALVKEAGNGASVATVAEAMQGAQVVLLAIPGSAVAAAVAPIAGQLAGMIVIDATNSMGGASMNSVAAVLHAA